MNWIKVVYFILKEIWPLFSISKAKKMGLFLNKIKSQPKFGLEVSSQWKLLHWGTVRYLMNWIQVVYFKLKEIWPLFSTAKDKKRACFLLPFRQSKWKYEIMKPNLSQKAMKLAPNDNYFTEEHHTYTYILYSKL